MNPLSSEVLPITELIGQAPFDSSNEAEELVAAIERAVRHRTGTQVRNLQVQVSRDAVRLFGRSPTYYFKQLAQQAAMAVPGVHRLVNSIVVE